MDPKKGKEIQFIHSSHPGDAQRPEAQRRVHAHAARVAHARRRQFRIIEYQGGESSKKENDDETAAGAATASGSKSAEDEPPVAPGLVDPATLLDAGSVDPFAALARTLSQIEAFLFNYYMHALIPHQVVHCTRLEDRELYGDLMSKQWTPAAIARRDTLDAMFLQSCRHLIMHQSHPPEKQEHYKQLAIRYKLSCLKGLNEIISSESSAMISDSTMGTVVVLGFDDLLSGNMAVSRHHAWGALQMVNHNGGSRGQGFGGLLKYLLYKLWRDCSGSARGQLLRISEVA